MLSNWAIKKLEHLTLDYMKLDCPEGACYGVMGVKCFPSPSLPLPSFLIVIIYHRSIVYHLPWYYFMQSSVVY